MNYEQGGNTLLASLIGADDPSPVDDAAGLRYAFFINNGSSQFFPDHFISASTSNSKTYTLAAPGNYEVTARVFDKDDGYRDYKQNFVVPDLSITPVSSTSQIQLTFQDIKPNSTHYRIQRSITGTEFEIYETIPRSQLQFAGSLITWTDDQLPDGATFWYRVRAVHDTNPANETGYSYKKSATTKRAPTGTFNAPSTTNPYYTVTGLTAAFATGATDPEDGVTVKYDFALQGEPIASSYNDSLAHTARDEFIDLTTRGTKTITARIFNNWGYREFTGTFNVIDNNPVVVLYSSWGIELSTSSPVTAETLRPSLWTDPGEVAWDIGSSGNPWQNLTDGNDTNTLAGDAYGWSFGTSSPDFRATGAFPRHDATMLAQIIGVPHVKVMILVGGSSASNASIGQAVQYVLEKKASGDANIVAMAGSIPWTNRASAIALRDADILAFTGVANNQPNPNEGGYDPFGKNKDTLPSGAAEELYSIATPRAEFQLPPVLNVIPVTTDVDNPTSYGANTFYFASPGQSAQSFASPAASRFAALAALAYMQHSSHLNVVPTWQQIKRAMMSGVEYKANLGAYQVETVSPGRTITYDYVGSARTGGGVLNQTQIEQEINASLPPNISIEAVTPPDPTDALRDFVLHDPSASVTDWTISWGDGDVRAVSGNQSTTLALSHEYPSGEFHAYYPTVYANFGTGDSRRVSFSSTVGIGVGQLLPTNTKDEWKLSREGDFSRLSRKSPTESVIYYPSDTHFALDVELGAGGDTFTIDYSGGDPLEEMDLRVFAVPSEDTSFAVIGTTMADNIEFGLGSHQTPSFRSVTVSNASYTSVPKVAPGVHKVTVYGGDGNDVVNAGNLWAENLLFGEAGDDFIIGGSGIDTLDGGAGNDTLRGNEGEDSLLGASGNDSLDGEDGDDTLTGGTGANSLIGAAGNDCLQGGASADYIDGGDDIDSVVYDRADGAVTISLDSTANDGILNEGDDLHAIEIVAGGSGNDTITLESGGLFIYAGAGNDSLTGSNGSDTIYGGTGTDTIHGAEGNDHLYANAGVLTEPPANDVLYGDAGNDTLEGDRGNQTLYGGSGDDIIWGGSEGSKFIYGEAGNDQLNASFYTSANLVSGGDGNDTLNVFPATEASGTLHGDAGDDIVLISSSVGQTVYGDAGNDTLTGGSGNDWMSGGDGNDIITGGNGNDTMYGDAGSDHFHAQDGYADTIDGGNDSALDYLDDADGSDSSTGIEVF